MRVNTYSQSGCRRRIVNKGDGKGEIGPSGVAISWCFGEVRQFIDCSHKFLDFDNGFDLISEFRNRKFKSQFRSGERILKVSALRWWAYT